MHPFNLVTLAVLSGASLFQQRNQAEHHEPRTIAVTAKGEAAAKPDYVILSLGFDSQDDELDQALAENNDRVSKALSVVKEYKVASKDYQTEDVSIWPRLKKRDDPKSVYYQVQKSLVVHVRDLSSFEALFTKLLHNGVNRVDSIWFRTSEEESLRKKAREMAVASAKEKAIHLAELLEQRTGKPLKVNEELEAIYGGVGFGGAMGAAGEPDPDPTFALGEVKVRATVQVTFELLERDAPKQ
jgi:uncharacterized protein YggE